MGNPRAAPVVTRTPLRLSLGGGSTDMLPYYEKHGGFIFAVAIDLYIDIFLKRLATDKRIQLNYSETEVVNSIADLKNIIGREALRIAGIEDSVSITFNADAPAGTGLGSSGSYMIGLLNGLYALNGERKEKYFLAEKAFELTQNLNKPDGKQDPYLAAFGGFKVLEIGTDGRVGVSIPNLSDRVVDDFLVRSLLFYTGVKRDSSEVLKDQEQATEERHRIKAIGRQILRAFETGRLDDFGHLMHEHWMVKKEMSRKISSDNFDRIYELAIHNGALGGKIVGAGGGGYFLFYCREEEQGRLVTALAGEDLERVNFNIDYQGTRTVVVS